MKKMWNLGVILVALILLTPLTADAQRRERRARQKAQIEGRGIRIEREECEELAMDITQPNMRAAGNAVSQNESMATSMALNNARAELAAQLEVYVNGCLRTFDQQYASENGMSYDGKSSRVQSSYFAQILKNVRPIKKNTYMKDGRYNVYVCIEMSPEQATELQRQLSQDQILSIDVQERQFLEEMRMMRQTYIEEQNRAEER
uniref:hypothetical protein n=1 Tax=Alistipes sp. TaxID=1872444 RepID=UPI0040573689